MGLFKNLLSPFRRHTESSLNDELRFHLEKEIELNMARGMGAEEARRQALITFGGVQQTREAVRRVSARSTLEAVVQDVRYGARMLRKAPGFTAIAVSILALGIGANTAIFSAVNAALFARWPVPNQQQLVLVKEATQTNSGFLVSVPDFEDYRRKQTTFANLSLLLGQSINLTGRERPDRLIGAFVSDNFFELLDVKASLGRTFLPGDDQPGAAPVAVISYEGWQTRFGGDPGFPGRQLTLNNEPYTVVGILPRGFSLALLTSEVFIPAQHYTSYKVERKAKSFLVFGRIKDGVKRAQATADLNTIAQRLAHDYPSENAGIHVELEGLQELSTQQIRAPLLALLGAVAMVLLLVCANIANLLLARGAARQREVAVRAALGAARGRLVRQFLSESMLVAALGGAGGILLGHLLLKALQKITPEDFSITSTAVLDLRVLMFTAGVSVLTGLLFGVAPALQFSPINLSSALVGGGRTTGHPSRDRVRAGFVVCQVAISLVLLVSAGLLVRSFHALLTTSPGFAPDHLLSMEYRLPPNKYKTAEAQANFHRQIAARVRQVPGVVSAAVVQGLPFSGNWGQVSFDLPEQATSTAGNGLSALYNPVSPEYFSTIGLPLLEGRGFSAHDDDKAAAVAIISQSFAQKYFPRQDAIGQEVQLKDTEELAFGVQGGFTKRAIIVGLVGSAKQRNVREALEPQIYFPYAQLPDIFGTLVVRTAVDPMSLSEAVRRAVWSVDKDQPVWKVRTVDFLIQRDTAPDRFAMVLMSALSMLALLLSALGTYGMLSQAVLQRTRELGVRIALGASTGSVLKLVLTEGLKLVSLGGALGIIGAIVSARLIRTLLYGVTPGDITAFALAVVAMLLIGVLASYLPARRATRVDPMVALRDE